MGLINEQLRDNSQVEKPDITDLELGTPVQTQESFLSQDSEPAPTTEEEPAPTEEPARQFIQEPYTPDLPSNEVQSVPVPQLDIFRNVVSPQPQEVNPLNIPVTKDYEFKVLPTTSDADRLLDSQSQLNRQIEAQRRVNANTAANPNLPRKEGFWHHGIGKFLSDVFTGTEEGKRLAAEGKFNVLEGSYGNLGAGTFGFINATLGAPARVTTGIIADARARYEGVPGANFGTVSKSITPVGAAIVEAAAVTRKLLEDLGVNSALETAKDSVGNYVLGDKKARLERLKKGNTYKGYWSDYWLSLLQNPVIKFDPKAAELNIKKYGSNFEASLTEPLNDINNAFDPKTGRIIKQGTFDPVFGSPRRAVSQQWYQDPVGASAQIIWELFNPGDQLVPPIVSFGKRVPSEAVLRVEPETSKVVNTNPFRIINFGADQGLTPIPEVKPKKNPKRYGRAGTQIRQRKNPPIANTKKRNIYRKNSANAVNRTKPDELPPITNEIVEKVGNTGRAGQKIEPEKLITTKPKIKIEQAPEPIKKAVTPPKIEPKPSPKKKPPKPKTPTVLAEETAKAPTALAEETVSQAPLIQKTRVSKAKQEAVNKEIADALEELKTNLKVLDGVDEATLPPETAARIKALRTRYTDDIAKYEAAISEKYNVVRHEGDYGTAARILEKVEESNKLAESKSVLSQTAENIKTTLDDSVDLGRKELDTPGFTQQNFDDVLKVFEQGGSPYLIPEAYNSLPKGLANLLKTNYGFFKSKADRLGRDYLEDIKTVVLRNNELLANPKPVTNFKPTDAIAVNAEYYHGTVVKGWQPNYNVSVFGSRGELGSGLYLTKNADEALEYSKAATTSNLNPEVALAEVEPNVATVLIKSEKALDANKSFEGTNQLFAKLTENLPEAVAEELKKLITKRKKLTYNGFLDKLDNAIAKSGVNPDEALLSNAYKQVSQNLRNYGYDAVVDEKSGWINLLDSSKAEFVKRTRTVDPSILEAQASRYNVDSLAKKYYPKRLTTAANLQESAYTVTKAAYNEVDDKFSKLQNEIANAVEANIKANPDNPVIPHLSLEEIDEIPENFDDIYKMLDDPTFCDI